MKVDVLQGFSLSLVLVYHLGILVVSVVVHCCRSRAASIKARNSKPSQVTWPLCVAC